MGDAFERSIRCGGAVPTHVSGCLARIGRATRFRRVLTRLVAAAIVLFAGAAVPAVAEESFQVEPLTGFAYPHPGPAATRYTIIVTFDPVKYDLETAHIRLATGPGGRALSIDAATTQLAPSGSNGSRLLIVTPKPDSFVAPGTYGLAIRLTGQEKSGESRKPAFRDLTVPITRNEPLFDLESLSGRSVTFVRAYPGADATGEVEFQLQSRQGDITALTLGNTGLVRAKTKELVPGATLTATPTPTDVPVNRTVGAQLKFTGLSRAGTFETTLTADSANFSKRQTATVTVQVKDCIVWALLVILIGVAGGVFVHWMATGGRASLVIRQRLLAARARLHRLRPAVASDTTRLLFLDLQQRVDEALWIADTSPGVPDDPKSIEDEIKALEDKIAKLRGDTATKLETLVTNISNESAAMVARVAGAKAQFDAALKLVADAQSLNSAGQVEAAAKQAGEIERGFATEQANVRQAALARIAIPNAHAADPMVVQAKTNATAALAGPIDIFVAALDKLAAAVAAAAGVQVAAPGAATIAVTGRYSIQLSNPNQRPVTGDSIELKVVAPLNRPTPAEVAWDYYGSGMYETKAGALTGTARYLTPGTHIVKAKITEAAGRAPEDVTFPVMVEPSQALKRWQQAAFAVWRNDLAVAVVAALLASIAATLQLYVDKPFGTAEDYLIALLYGFGFEKTVRGFSAVYTSLGGKTF
jgi:hypothetical protein